MAPYSFTIAYTQRVEKAVLSPGSHTTSKLSVLGPGVRAEIYEHPNCVHEDTIWPFGVRESDKQHVERAQHYISYALGLLAHSVRLLCIFFGNT